MDALQHVLLHFAASPWLFALVALPGVWLAHALYGLPGIPDGMGRPRGAASRHPLLGLTYALAWLLLALWVVSPSLRTRSETWHPPAVLLVVDDSPRYAALGARDSARRTMDSARTHYAARGFKVAETTLRAMRESKVALASSVPNLQAVLLLSDGRTPPDSFPSFWTRVFPVLPALATREVQGESAFVAVDEEGDGGDGGGDDRLVVRWRALGQRVDAKVEVLVANRIVWSGTLSHPVEIQPGAEVATNVDIPALPREGGAKVRVVVRPLRTEDNTLTLNDTLAVHDGGSTRVTQRVVRPLATLDERGLVDALREEASFVVRTVRLDDVAAETDTREAGAVTWFRAGRDRQGLEAPLVIYHLAQDGADEGKGFSADARVTRAAGGEAFLPAGVVRLADLGVSDGGGEGGASGVSTLVLSAPREGIEPLAWAEEGGRRGLLIWREKATGVVGVALPPLWSLRGNASALSEGTEGAARSVTLSSSAAWLRGVALWSLALHRAESGHGKPARTDDSSSAPEHELKRVGYDREALARLAARHDGSVLMMTKAEPEWPQLPDGEVRERAARLVNITPPALTACLLALLFAAVWAWRKRTRLD